MLDNKIIEHKEEIIKWKKDLLNLLSNSNFYKKRKVYLIRQLYLNNYENTILKPEIMNKNSILRASLYKIPSIYNETNELFSQLNDPKKEIDKLPKIFPLNEETYRGFQNIILYKDNNNKFPEEKGIKGLFAENLLEIELNKLFYLFFFEYDGYLRQGFLRIKDENLSEKIMFELKRDTPTYFVKNYTGNKINDKESCIKQPEFDLYIFSKFDINIEKLKKEFEQINEEKNLKFLSKSMRIPPSKLNLINIEERMKSFVQKYEKNIIGLNNIFNSTISSKTITRKRGHTFNVKNINQFTFRKKENNIEKEINEKENNNNKQNKNEYINNNNNNPNGNFMDSNSKLGYTWNKINNSDINYNLGETQIIQNDIPKKEIISEIDEDKIEEVEEIQEEPSRGLVGLENIGATCYMNATLQCFSNVEFLREEFLAPEMYSLLEQNKQIKMRLSFALAEVLKNLWLKFDIKHYPPQYFKEVISNMNPLFKGIAANDPKDLILFMLETMHNELKTVDSNINVDNDFIPDERKLEEVYKDFSNYYLSKNKSIIFDIFYGCTNIVTGCVDCRTESHNVQVSNILFFPLEEVRKFRNYNNEMPVNVYDCFEYNRRIDIYHSYYCNYCNNNNSTAISFTRYLYTPKVIIINLNRGKGIQFHVKFNFEEFLDIRNYVAARDSPYKYELIGVICHFGESGMGGHFIAFCKHIDYNGSKWYKFNDGMVNETDFKEVQTVGMPYVLFYSYIDIAK